MAFPNFPLKPLRFPKARDNQHESTFERGAKIRESGDSKSCCKPSMANKKDPADFWMGKLWILVALILCLFSWSDSRSFVEIPRVQGPPHSGHAGGSFFCPEIHVTSEENTFLRSCVMFDILWSIGKCPDSQALDSQKLRQLISNSSKLRTSQMDRPHVASACGNTFAFFESSS